jgi:hypothetical protein
MNTAIQAYDPTTQYNAHDHLLTWSAFNKKSNKTEIVQYYPANWRLYELRLRYPAAKFEVDLILVDQERNFCIVRARLWVGPDYDTADVRAVAHKQGPLSELDRIETKAKARAARDLGISTELALDMDDTPDNEVQGTIVTAERPQPPTLDPDRPCSDQQFATINKLQKELGMPLTDCHGMTFGDCSSMLKTLQERLQQKRKAS